MEARVLDINSDSGDTGDKESLNFFWSSPVTFHPKEKVTRIVRIREDPWLAARDDRESIVSKQSGKRESSRSFHFARTISIHV